MFNTVKTRLSTWNKARKTVNELASLSDRELADIGISRPDIRWVVAQNR